MRHLTLLATAIIVAFIISGAFANTDDQILNRKLWVDFENVKPEEVESCNDNANAIKLAIDCLVGQTEIMPNTTMLFFPFIHDGSVYKSNVEFINSLVSGDVVPPYKNMIRKFYIKVTGASLYSDIDKVKAFIPRADEKLKQINTIVNDRKESKFFFVIVNFNGIKTSDHGNAGLDMKYLFLIGQDKSKKMQVYLQEELVSIK